MLQMGVLFKEIGQVLVNMVDIDYQILVGVIVIFIYGIGVGFGFYFVQVCGL